MQGGWWSFYHFVQKLPIDSLLITEQHRHRDPHYWFCDSLFIVAFWARNKQEGSVQSHRGGWGFVWLKCRDETFYRCYFTPNEPIQDFHGKIKNLEESAINTTRYIIVGRDCNAKAVEWGIPYTSSQGKYIMGFATRSWLVMLNEGDTPTFQYPRQRGTIPYISLASGSLISRISDWKVVKEYTGSDCILYSIYYFWDRPSAC